MTVAAVLFALFLFSLQTASGRPWGCRLAVPARASERWERQTVALVIGVASYVRLCLLLPPAKHFSA